MVILYHLTNFYNDQSKNMTGFDVQGRPFIRNLSSKWFFFFAVSPHPLNPLLPFKVVAQVI